MWLSIPVVTCFIVVNYVSAQNASIFAPALTSNATTTRVPVNSSMVLTLPKEPLEHKMKQYSSLLFACNYPNSSDEDLIRYWIFKAGESLPASTLPSDSGCVILTNSSNSGNYPGNYTIDALGKYLNLTNLTTAQTGRYWCVSSNLDYQRAASWDLGVYVLSSYLVESIVLLVINGVLFLVFIFCSVYTYWRNRRYVVRHKRLDAANSSTERSTDAADTGPRA